MTIGGTDEESSRNVVAPIGMRVGDVLSSFGFAVDPERQVVVAGGLMMGQAVPLDYPVNKGTISLAILDRKGIPAETSCILCGACSNICPLKLHPWGIISRIRSGESYSAALRMQLDECFLCGACSAVCPTHIPLVREFRKAKP